MIVDVRQIPKLPPAWLARLMLALHRALSHVNRSLLPPQLYLFELSTALWTAQCLHAIARLGIADRLAVRPATAEELSGDLGLHAGSLYRVLRLLAGYGIFTEDRLRRFALSRIGEKLRPAAAGSAHALLLYNGQRWQTEPYAEVEYTLRTGKPAFDHVFAAPFFEYAARHPDLAAQFDAAMTSVTQLHVGAVLGAYRFDDVDTLADIGGGNGLLISAILAAHPRLHGILFDLPRVVDGAAPQLRNAGVAGRCDVRAGDFFEAVPAGADAYLLSHIMHDWDDRRCDAILRACRASMPPNGRLLIVDVIVAEGDNRFDQGKLTDMQMLLVLTGRERTTAEFRELLAAAGFSIRRIIRTAAPECIIEAVPSA
jgi:O-methyltransferase domain